MHALSLFLLSFLSICPRPTRDTLVNLGRDGKLSAAVVFLPEKTKHFGKHGDDRCYCRQMYGEVRTYYIHSCCGGERWGLTNQLSAETQVKPWGCKWFQLWREHVEKAVDLGQTLQVFYLAGYVGRGKAPSWEACGADALRRDQLYARKKQYLQHELPKSVKRELETLSSKPRDDSKGELPGTERGDEEERVSAVEPRRRARASFVRIRAYSLDRSLTYT